MRRPCTRGRSSKRLCFKTRRALFWSITTLQENEPSREDYEITQKIKTACQTVSIRVLDHIIIGENQYFSFSERSQL